jgi:hypothetical protein
MGFTVTMRSAEFGAEEFHYDTLVEAAKGIKNLRQAAEDLDDGIERTFDLKEN